MCPLGGRLRATVHSCSQVPAVRPAADEEDVNQRPSCPARGGRMKGLGKMAVPIGVVAIVLMLVVPLPAALLDLLLALNITASLLILLVAMQIKKPLDFAVFPSLLLVATLFRLALNVCSTRLVLTDGYAGQGHRGVRPLRRRRLAGRRPGHLPDPDDHPVRRHHQRCRPRGRGRRPLHPRRHARQADGDRRRPQRRPDRRGAGPPAPPRGHRRGRLLRRDGRCVEVRQGRRHRRRSSSRWST